MIQYFGEYEITGKLGSGGSAVVYRAVQRSLNREVALKIIHGHSCGESEEHFRLAAEAMAVLDHPDIVSIYETGDHEGQAFCCMELIEPGKPGGVPETMARIADAVAYAHARGVIHGDLKPSNVLYSEDGCPVVVDFAMPDRRQAGSPLYMAPEMLTGGELTTAVDVYGLGALLFHRLTGRPPFEGDSIAEIARKILEETPGLPKSTDRELSLLCQKCLSKDPEERPRASQLAEEFRRIVRGEPILLQRPGVFTRLIKWCRRRPVETGLAVATGIVLLLGTALPAMRIFPTLEEPDRFGAAMDAGGGVLAVGVPSTSSVEIFDVGEEILFRERIDFEGISMGRILALDVERITAGGFTSKYKRAGTLHSVPLSGGDGWHTSFYFMKGYHRATLSTAGDSIWSGTPGYADGTGQVIQFTKAGEKIREINPPDALENQFFGSAVSVFGRHLAISAPGTGTLAGAVSIFDVTDGSVLHTLRAGGDGGRFGWALHSENGLLLAGAPGENDNRGAAYLIDLNSGAIKQRIPPPPDAQPGDRFGEAVAILEGTAVIGAPQRPGHLIATHAAMPGHGAGYVALIDLNTGVMRSKLQPPGGRIGDAFGEKIQVDAGRVFVTAPRHFFDHGLRRHARREWGRVEVFDFKSGEHEVTLRSQKASQINWLPVWIYGLLAGIALLIFFYKKK